MTSATNTPVRAASPPAVGGLRGAILSALVALIARIGLPPEFSDPVVAALSALVGFGLTWLGKVVRNKLPWVPGILIPF